MRKLVWPAVAGLLLALPGWAWDEYRPLHSYGAGTTRGLHLQNDLNTLERQVRDLQRQVDRLQGARGTTPASEYPLPGQAVHGFQRTRDGAYELSLNGAKLRIGPDGELYIRAARGLRLEGETIVSTARAGGGQ